MRLMYSENVWSAINTESQRKCIWKFWNQHKYKFIFSFIEPPSAENRPFTTITSSHHLFHFNRMMILHKKNAHNPTRRSRSHNGNRPSANYHHSPKCDDNNTIERHSQNRSAGTKLNFKIPQHKMLSVYHRIIHIHKRRFNLHFFFSFAFIKWWASSKVNRNESPKYEWIVHQPFNKNLRCHSPTSPNIFIQLTVCCQVLNDRLASANITWIAPRKMK